MSNLVLFCVCRAPVVAISALKGNNFAGVNLGRRSRSLQEMEYICENIYVEQVDQRNTAR